MEAPHYVVTKSKTPQIVHVKPAVRLWWSVKPCASKVSIILFYTLVYSSRPRMLGVLSLLVSFAMLHSHRLDIVLLDHIKYSCCIVHRAITRALLSYKRNYTKLSEGSHWKERHLNSFIIAMRMQKASHCLYGNPWSGHYRRSFHVRRTASESNKIQTTQTGNISIKLHKLMQQLFLFLILFNPGVFHNSTQSCQVLKSWTSIVYVRIFVWQLWYFWCFIFTARQSLEAIRPNYPR